MSEAEAIEALSDMAINVSTFFSIFVSLTFAYLTVAYLVGKELSRFQLVIINYLYILCTVLMGASMAIWNEAWLKLHHRETTVFSGSWLLDAINWKVGAYVMLASILVASLYFMHDIRKERSQ